MKRGLGTLIRTGMLIAPLVGGAGVFSGCAHGPDMVPVSSGQAASSDSSSGSTDRANVSGRVDDRSGATSSPYQSTPTGSSGATSGSDRENVSGRSGSSEPGVASPSSFGGSVNVDDSRGDVGTSPQRKSPPPPASSSPSDRSDSSLPTDK